MTVLIPGTGAAMKKPELDRADRLSSTDRDMRMYNDVVGDVHGCYGEWTTQHRGRHAVGSVLGRAGRGAIVSDDPAHVYYFLRSKLLVIENKCI